MVIESNQTEFQICVAYEQQRKPYTGHIIISIQANKIQTHMQS